MTSAFFKNGGYDPGYWKCTICDFKRKQSGASWANLVSHVKDAHPTYETLMTIEDGRPKLKQSAIVPIGMV